MGADPYVTRENDLDVLMDGVLSTVVNGGNRVAVREVLRKAWEHGRVFGVWEPTTVTEATGRPNGVAKGEGKVRTTGRTVEEIVRLSRYPNLVLEPIEDEPDSVSALKGWWEQTAHDEVAQLVVKMVEYGGLSRATDLAEIGRGLANSGVKMPPELATPEQEARYQELGCYFYLLGKFARWTAAVAEGRAVSDDTLLDIGIYVRMVQRIRAVGGWPV